MSESQKIKVIISPDALAQMESLMTPEDLQTMLNEIQMMVDNGTLFEESELVDIETMQIEDPETYAKLKNAMDAAGVDCIDDWIDQGKTQPTLN